MAELERRGYPGMESFFLIDPNLKATTPYLAWVVELFRDVLQESDEARAARYLNFAVSQRGIIFEQCLAKSHFAESLSDPLWGRLKDFERRRPESFEWLAIHPHVWDALNLGDKGVKVMADWGPLGVDLLFGPLSYPPDTHAKVVLDALSQPDKEPVVNALWTLRELHRGRDRSKLDDLLAKGIDEDLLHLMLADIINSQRRGEGESRATYWAGLPPETIHEELRDQAGLSGFNKLRAAVAATAFAVSGPVGAGIALVYETGVIAKRAAEGREIRTQDIVREVIAVASFGSAVYSSMSAPVGPAASSGTSSDSGHRGGESAPASRELTLANGTCIKVQGEAARGLQFGETFSRILKESSVTISQTFARHAHLNITGPIRLNFLVSGRALGTYDALSKEGVLVMAGGSVRGQAYFDLDPKFVADKLGDLLIKTARAADPEGSARPGSSRDHEAAWKKNVATWLYGNAVRRDAQATR